MITELELSPGLTEIGFGYRVEIEFIDPLAGLTPGGEVAFHESVHVVAALEGGVAVIKATNEPGPGYLGMAQLAQFDAPSFMASDAMGCKGTTHDVRVVEKMGHDPGAAASAALSRLHGNDEEVFGVAALIETKRTISGRAARWMIDKIRNPEYRVKIKDPMDEEKHQFVTKIKKGQPCLIPIEICIN